MTIPKAGMSLLTPALTMLEQNPLAQTVVKDVFGFNAPKVLATRTADERWDVATLEMSNTAITIGASLILPFLVRYPVSWVSGVKLDKLAGKVVQNAVPQVKLARLGAALGFLFPFASAFWAAAFFRNYVTAKRTKTANFEEIIGLEQRKNKKLERPLEEELKYQLKMMTNVLLTGLGLGVLTGLGFALSARRLGKTLIKNGVETAKQNLSKPMDWVFRHFQLEGEKANQVNHGLATFMFWLAPAYLGWLHASRGDNELKEQGIKAANAIVWFSLFTPLGLNPIFKKNFKKLIKENKIPSYKAILTEPRYKKVKHSLLKLKNKQFGIGLGVTILMLGLTPQWLNIYLTQRRHEKELAKEADAIRIRISSGDRLTIRANSTFRVFIRIQNNKTLPVYQQLKQR